MWRISIHKSCQSFNTYLMMALSILVTSIIMSCNEPEESDLQTADASDAHRCMIVENQKVLMVKVSHAGCTYDLPGGYRKVGESPRANAAREAWEEAGICAETVGNKDNAGIFSCRRASNNKCSGYQRTLSENCGGPEWVSLSKLDQIRSRLRGSAPYSTLQRALKNSGASSSQRNRSASTPQQVSNDSGQQGNHHSPIPHNTENHQQNNGERLPWDQKSCQQHKEWGNCGKDFMIREGACQITCGQQGNHHSPTPNNAENHQQNNGERLPYDGKSCQQHKEWGNCGKDFMIREGACQITCGSQGHHSPSVSDHAQHHQQNNGERLPWDQKSCQQHKEWGNCGKDFMIREGACHITCGSAAPAAHAPAVGGGNHGHVDECGCPPGQGYSSTNRRCQAGSVTEEYDFQFCK